MLCPIYSAGEKINRYFNYHSFGKLIAKKSNVNVVVIKSENDLLNYFRKNLFNNELVVCMGAGSISAWIKNISVRL